MDMLKFAQPATTATRTGAVLIDKLLDAGLPLVEADGIDAFIAAPGLHVLFITGDPVRLLDSVDIAVVLGELLRRFDTRLTAGVCARAAEPAMASRFGADVRPALVFFAAGEHLGTIPRVRDWDEYITRIDAYLARTQSPTRQ